MANEQKRLNLEEAVNWMIEEAVDPSYSRGETLLVIGPEDEEVTLDFTSRGDTDNSVRMYWSNGRVTETTTTMIESNYNEGEWHIDNDGTATWFPY